MGSNPTLSARKESIMKIIFLDIDGVLNNYKFLCENQGKSEIDEKAVKVLGRICKRLDAKVVISSSWRLCWNDNWPHIEAAKKLLKKHNIEVIGLTSTDSRLTRGEQIKKFVWDNCICADSWVAVDDDELDIPSERFVQTDFQGAGLTMRHLPAIRKALRRPIKEDWI